MNVVKEAEDVLKSIEIQPLEKEELYGRLWDNEIQDWTNALVYHQPSGTGHLFRIRMDGKIMLEMRGIEFGRVLSSLLHKWEERNNAS